MELDVTPDRVANVAEGVRLVTWQWKVLESLGLQFGTLPRGIAVDVALKEVPSCVAACDRAVLQLYPGGEGSPQSGLHGNLSAMWATKVSIIRAEMWGAFHGAGAHDDPH